jgi:hypothetical protein
MNKQELIEKIGTLNKLYGERHYVAMKMFYGLNLRNGQKISDFEANVIETYCFANGLPSPVYDEV